jgi:hypothetical protein
MHAAWDCEMLAGEHAAAEQAIRHGCEQLERLGEHSYLSTYACELAEALYALGRYEESEQWALRGLELGSKDDLATQLFGLSVRSRLLAAKVSSPRPSPWPNGSTPSPQAPKTQETPATQPFIAPNSCT